MISLVLALCSVLMRASTGVIDRNSFGLKSQPIVMLNFLNNFLPALLLVAPLLVIDRNRTLAYLVDPKFIALGLAVQLVAFAFSYGFKHLTVARVNLAGRLGDICIPIALALIGVHVTPLDFIFSLIISSIIVALTWNKNSRSEFHSLLIPGLLITLALVFQSIAGELAYAKPINDGLYNATFACLSTLVWRSFFCLPFMLGYFHKAHRGLDLSFLKLKPARKQLSMRTFFTLGSQLTFNYVLASGNRLVTWPILNSVAVFSVVIAGIFIKEKAHVKEWIAVILVVALSIIRIIVVKHV